MMNVQNFTNAWCMMMYCEADPAVLSQAALCSQGNSFTVAHPSTSRASRRICLSQRVTAGILEAGVRLA